MNLKGDATRYGAPAGILHWATAAAVVLLLPVGFLAARSSDPAMAILLLRLHVAVGLLVLALTIGRLAWRWFDRRPDPVPGPRWRTATAGATHALLYGLLVAMTASGIALMLASGAAPILFDGAPGPLPRFTAFRPLTGHALGPWALLALVILHVGAALYHQFRRRDGLLSRMALRADRR